MPLCFWPQHGGLLYFIKCHRLWSSSQLPLFPVLMSLNATHPSQSEVKIRVNIKNLFSTLLRTVHLHIMHVQTKELQIGFDTTILHLQSSVDVMICVLTVQQTFVLLYRNFCLTGILLKKIKMLLMKLLIRLTCHPQLHIFSWLHSKQLLTVQ